jgi:hypothetical protein
MKGRTSMKARLGIATAVVVGGGAIGVAVAATGSHSTPTTAQSSAYGYTLNFRHTVSEGAALSAALTQWSWSHQKAMTTLAEMQAMRTFEQTTWHHRTTYAAQRGVVVLATKKFLLVQSAKNPNGALHLWWLKGTSFANVSSSATGMAAMTGNNTAAFQAMQNNNMTPATTTMAGSTVAAQQMAAPVAKPTTVTVSTGNETITITITTSTATVTTPTTTATTAPTPTVTPTAVKTTQPVFTKVNGVAKGDLVFVAGERVRGQLIAKLVLFAARSTTTTTPTATPTVAPSSTSSDAVTGTHS